MQFATYKFYDAARRRCSIFSRVVEDKLEIIIIPCYGVPQFSKKIGKNIYLRIEETGEIPDYCSTFVIGIKENKPRRTFLEWCENRFLRKFTATVTVQKEYLSAKPQSFGKHDERRIMIFLK